LHGKKSQSAAEEKCPWIVVLTDGRMAKVFLYGYRQKKYESQQISGIQPGKIVPDKNPASDGGLLCGPCRRGLEQIPKANRKTEARWCRFLTHFAENAATEESFP